MSITFSFLLTLISTISIACGGGESIRTPKKLFLLQPGKGPGQLALSSAVQNNGDLLPLQSGEINFDSRRITIIDPINKKIMILNDDGSLIKEHPLPEKSGAQFYTSLAVDSAGRIFFLSARNTEKGRAFALWSIHKQNSKKILEMKTKVTEKSEGKIQTTVTSLPTALAPLDDDSLAVVWKSMIVKTARNPKTGVNEYIYSAYTVSNLQILNHTTGEIRAFELQPSFFKDRAGKGYLFRRIDRVRPLSGGQRVLINTDYISSKNSREVRRLLFSVSLKDGSAQKIPIPDSSWNGILGVTESDRIYTLDRVYSRGYKTRASISIWKISGKKLLTFRIESDPVSRISGGLFLSRDGTLFSFQWIRSTIYTKRKGIQFLSWK